MPAPTLFSLFLFLLVFSLLDLPRQDPKDADDSSWSPPLRRDGGSIALHDACSPCERHLNKLESLDAIIHKLQSYLVVGAAFCEVR